VRLSAHAFASICSSVNWALRKGYRRSLSNDKPRKYKSSNAAALLQAAGALLEAIKID